MSLTTVTPVTYRLPQVTGANGSHSEVPKTKMVVIKPAALPALKVRGKEGKPMQESLTARATSRRELMHLTAASVGLASLILPGTAKADILSEIMKTFQELGEKVGFSKLKVEDETTKEAEGKTATLKSETKEAESKDEAEGKTEIPKSETKEAESKPDSKVKEEKPTSDEPIAQPTEEGLLVPASEFQN